MKYLSAITAQIKQEKSGWLVGVAALYTVTVVVAVLWKPEFTCQLQTVPGVFQCVILKSAEKILAVLMLLTGVILIASHRRPNAATAQYEAVIGGLIAYLLLAGAWVGAYCLL